MDHSPIAIVTGASRGIGAATSLLLAQRGYDICLSYQHDKSAAQQIVKQINQHNQRALAVQTDVADAEQVAHLFTQCTNQLGTPYALVNNAGIVGDKTRVEDISEQRLQRIFAVNVLGTIYCCQQASRIMSTQHGGAGGSIVNVSSVASRLGAPGEYVDYAATKGAVDSFTLGLAKELALDNVRVNAVRPGIIDTEIHATGGQPDRVARLSPLIPMQRGGAALEVATAIIWLLSEEASYTTGTLLDVSGGR